MKCVSQTDEGLMPNGLSYSRYEAVELEEGTVNKNDIVAVAPEVRKPSEGIEDLIVVGYIDDIYDVEGQDVPELSVSFPAGRWPLDESVVAIKGEEINLIRDPPGMNFIDKFINSDYLRYMRIERTASGSIRVEGV